MGTTPTLFCVGSPPAPPSSALGPAPALSTHPPGAPGLPRCRAAIWPHGRESMSAINKEEFLPTHAQLVQASGRQLCRRPFARRCLGWCCGPWEAAVVLPLLRPAPSSCPRASSRLFQAVPLTAAAHTLSLPPSKQVLALVVPEVVPAFRAPLEAALRCALCRPGACLVGIPLPAVHPSPAPMGACTRIGHARSRSAVAGQAALTGMRL